MTGPLTLLFDPLRLAGRLTGSAARLVGLGFGGEREDGRPLRWSAPLEEVVKRIVAGQELSLWVEGRRGLRRPERIHLLLQPLREVAVMGEGPDPLPGATREHWLVWQSLTGVAEPTRIPTDAARLARRLRLPPSAEGRLLERALGDLMASVYESRAI